MNTMTMDLWTEAVRDEDHERLTAALERAEGALASKFAFVSEATSQRAYEDRLAVISSTVEAGVAAATSGDPVLFAVVHQALLTQWEVDFQRIAAIRRQEVQRRNHRRGYERNAARRVVAWGDMVPFEVGERVAETSGGTVGTVVEVDGTSVTVDWGFERTKGVPGSKGTIFLNPYQTWSLRRATDNERNASRRQAMPNGWIGATGARVVQGAARGTNPLDPANAPWNRPDRPYLDADGHSTDFIQSKPFVPDPDEWEQVGDDQYKFKGWKPEPTTSARKVAYTQDEADAIAARIPDHARARLTPFIPYIVYGPSYSRSVAENLRDALKFANDPTASESYEMVCSRLDAATSADPGNWYYDQAAGKYTERLDGTMASKTAVGEFQRADRGWVRRGEGLLSGGQANWVHVTGPDDQSPARVTYPTGYESDCSWCYLNAPHSEAAHVESIASYTASKRPLTGAWIAPFVDQVRTTGMATIGFTGRTGSRRAITLVHEGSLIHWAVTDDSGEQEDGSGSGKSVRDTLEQAWDLLNKVLDKQPPPTGDIADQAQEAEKAVGEAVDAAGGDSASAQPGKQPAAPDASAPPAKGDAPADPKAPPAKGDAGAQKDKALDDENGEGTPSPDPAGDSKKPDFIKDKGDAPADPKAGPTDEAAAPPALPTDDAASGDAGATANTPDAVVDQAEDNSLGDVLGIDPTTMQPGTRTNMTYTLSDGTTGDVEVTFIREDNEIFFFDGPNGEFGLGDRDGEWVDSEGNSFAFSEGDAIEEITGDDAQPGATLDEIDLDVPVAGGEDVVVEDVAPDAEPGAEAPAEDAPAEEPADDKADDGKPDFAKKDDDEDEDVKKVKEAMLRENPNMPPAVASRLAARAAAMAKVL